MKFPCKETILFIETDSSLFFTPDGFFAQEGAVSLGIELSLKNEVFFHGQLIGRILLQHEIYPFPDIRIGLEKRW